MSDSSVLYFAYGANMSRDVLERQRGIRPLSVEAAHLPDFRLAFDLPGIPVVEPGFASIVPAPGESVHGVLYRLTDRDLAHIRTHESPRYRWLDVDVVGCESGRVRARAFQNPEPVVGLLPSRRYLRVLCAGARASGLPEDYVTRLEAHPAAYVPLVSDAFTASWGVVLGVLRWNAMRRSRPKTG